MSNDTVSIIVPIYNQSTRIEHCIESILAQSYQKNEIILVDDGSTDDSYEKCCKFASKDNRFIVKHQKNSGVSQARNTGITCASGKYLMFVDSDDWLDAKCVETYIKKFNNGYLNIFSYFLIHESAVSKIALKGSIVNSDAQITKLNIDSIPELYRKQLFNSVWNKVYDTSIVQNNCISFNPDLTIGEDAVFNLDYLSHTGSGIRVIDTPVYYYQKESSGTLDSSHYDNFLSDQFTIFEAFYDFLVAHKANQQTLKKMNSYMTSSLIAVLDRIPSSKTTSEESDLIQTYLGEIESYLKRVDPNAISLISRIRWFINKHGGYPFDKKLRNGIKRILHL